MKKETIQRVLVLMTVMAANVFSTMLSTYIDKKDKTPPPKKEVFVCYVDTVQHFKKVSAEIGLKEALDYYEVKFPEIVYAQCLLETGNFTSNVYKKHNNLFGLYNSNTKSYYHFDNWYESVEAYVNLVQYRYNSEANYYAFLQRIQYSKDKNYIKKIKQIKKENE